MSGNGSTNGKSPTKRLRKSSTYKTNRKQVIIRDKGICQICGKEGTEVDHILSLALGGTHDLDNLQVICTDCHRIKNKIDEEILLKKREDEIGSA